MPSLGAYEAAGLHRGARRGSLSVAVRCAGTDGRARGAAAQASKAPLVGFLNSASPVTYRFNANAFLRAWRKPASSRAATCASRSAGQTLTTMRFRPSQVSSWRKA